MIKLLIVIVQIAILAASPIELGESVMYSPRKLSSHKSSASVADSLIIIIQSNKTINDTTTANVNVAKSFP